MIRWITPRLGTAPWGQVQSSSDTHLLDVRDLVDRAGNVPSDVKLKIDEGVEQLSRGKTVIVCCDYGISRSNAIAAGVVAVSDGKTFDEALSDVFQATGEDSVKLEVLSAVRNALGQRRLLSASSASVLVTGGTGFIGKKLVAGLADHVPVVAPGRDEVDVIGPSFRLDQLVRERQVGTVVHLAHPRILTANRSLGEAITAMKNVLDVCRENDLRLIYVSDWEVFSGYRTPDPIIADETLPPLPESAYGFSKVLCESLARHMADLHGFRYCLVRSGPVFGREGRRPRFIRTFVAKALRNDPIAVHRYRNDLPRLELMHVDDLVAGIRCVVDAEVTGVFHLGSGVLMSTTEIAERVSGKLESGSTIVVKDVDSEVSNVIMSTVKARSRLAWSTTVDPWCAMDQLIDDIANRVDDPDPVSERTIDG